MKVETMVSEYFEKSLLLVYYLESQTELLEKKASAMENTGEANCGNTELSSVLSQLKINNKKVKEKLSALAFELSTEN